jgi:hypothetical protein
MSAPSVEWNQVNMSGKPLPHWLATVAGSVIFASVSQQPSGSWCVNFSPKGRGLREPISYHYPYATREKAMAHVERWAAHHWATLPKAGPPPCGISERSLGAAGVPLAP